MGGEEPVISMFQIENYIKYYVNTLKFHAKDTRLKLSGEKSEPIHVIANGPTFIDTCKYINEIPGKTMMCNFALNNFRLFVPDYYVLADPLYRCIDPTYRGQYYDYIKENNNDEVLDRMSQLREKLLTVDKKMVIFSPPFLKLDHIIDNPCITWKYVNTSVYLPLHVSGVSKIWKNNAASPRVQSVVVLEIYAALQMGFKMIYLHGCEESCIFGGAMNVNQDTNKVEFQDSHFYSKGSRKTWNDMNMLSELRSQEKLFTSLYELEDYSKQLHARIINMSKNSWVDCFERYSNRV